MSDPKAAALLTAGTKSVANPLFPDGTQKKDNGQHLPAANAADDRPHSGRWWDPAKGKNNSYADDHFNGPGTDPLPAGGSVIPINRGTQLSGNSSLLKNGSPSGAPISQEPYVILGLATSSTPSASLVNSTTNLNSTPQALSFSLSGDLSLVPSDNLATGGGNVVLAATPEPSTGALWGMGMAGLMLQRRRKAKPSD